MIWEDKQKMISLGEAMKSDKTEDSTKLFNEHVILHLNIFDTQAWAMFLDSIEISPELIRQNKKFYKGIYPWLRGMAKEELGLRWAIRHALLETMIEELIFPLK